MISCILPLPGVRAVVQVLGRQVVRQNGFTQLAIVLLLFWAYPMYGILSGNNINKYLAYICPLGAFIVIVCYIYSKNAEIFGSFMNLAGNGAWIFLFSTLVLGIGIFQRDWEHRQ